MATITINSLTGNFTGTSGDDIFVFTAPTGQTGFTGSISGLGGNDRLVLLGAAQPITDTVMPLTYFDLSAAALNSIEMIEFASTAGTWMAGQFAYGQLPDGTVIIGGAGRDGLQIITNGMAGVLNVPAFSYQNWGTSTGLPDFTLLLNTNSSGVILNARDGVPGEQVLGNFGGPATLNGSSGSDVCLIDSGIIANGGSGDDKFEFLFSSANPSFSAFQLDGGAGYDRLIIDDAYNVSNATLVNIEALTFQTNPIPNMPPPSLIIDTATTGAQPVIQLEGTGTLTLNLSGQFFNGAGVTFAPGANIGGSINGTALADTITGTSGSDLIYGNAGKDFLRGAVGNDTLFGGDGNDRLEGGKGNDALNGGKGAVILVGGIGSDQFIFQAAVDSRPGTARDQILDFHHAEGDRIQLILIDANVNLAGDQAFFLGGSAFTHHAGEIVQVASGSDMIVKADVNGDGLADFALLLKGVSVPLSAGDFVL